jgi:hypothetical protein
MQTHIQEMILALIQGYTKLIDRSSNNDHNDNVTKQLRIKGQMLNEHTYKCRHINQMNIQLGNLTPPEQLQEKALNNQKIFEQETPILKKSVLENDPELTFDSASKIDALYEQRIY